MLDDITSACNTMTGFARVASVSDLKSVGSALDSESSPLVSSNMQKYDSVDSKFSTDRSSGL